VNHFIPQDTSAGVCFACQRLGALDVRFANCAFFAQQIVHGVAGLGAGPFGSVPVGDGTLGLMITGGFTSFSRSSNALVPRELDGSALEVEFGVEVVVSWELQPITITSTMPSSPSRLPIESFAIGNAP
jgi:hypothetical protein